MPWYFTTGQVVLFAAPLLLVDMQTSWRPAGAGGWLLDGTNSIIAAAGAFCACAGANASRLSAAAPSSVRRVCESMIALQWSLRTNTTHSSNVQTRLPAPSCAVHPVTLHCAHDQGPKAPP